MELSPRLRCVADQVPARARFADIGTDHAHLPVYLIRTGRIGSAIASDLRAGPLERAKKTAIRHHMEDKISFRLGSGLSAVRPDEADTIAIAGMGGQTITGILEASPWAGLGVHLFLLQPQSGIPELRVWLCEHEFSIEKEHIVSEGKRYYIVLTVRSGVMTPLSPGEQWAGRQRCGMESPLRAEYLDHLERRVKKALSGLKRSSSPESISKLMELTAVAADLEHMKKEWQAWQQ